MQKKELLLSFLLDFSKTRMLRKIYNFWRKSNRKIKCGRVVKGKATGHNIKRIPHSFIPALFCSVVDMAEKVIKSQVALRAKPLKMTQTIIKAPPVIIHTVCHIWNTRRASRFFLVGFSRI